MTKRQEHHLVTHSGPPIIMLDVDGVLNACGYAVERTSYEHTKIGSAVGPFHTGEATTDWRTYPIMYAPLVAQRLRALHDSGLAEIMWLTTWGYDADAEIAPLVGLPRDLPVIATAPGRVPTRHLATQTVTVSDPGGAFGERTWWKLVAVRQMRELYPGRPLIWVDDDIDFDRKAVDFIHQDALLFSVVPDTRLGLTTSDLESIERVCRVASATRESA